MTALGLLLLAPLLAPQSGSEVSEIWSFPEARQFDFWIGDWDVNLRVLQDGRTWADSVAARARIYRILDGKAILELWDSPDIKGYSLRYYDREAGAWVLYLNWPGKNRSGTSRLTGGFRHGRGEFFSSTQDGEGDESVSRYTFCDITPTTLRWDDAYSKDGGRTWTHNWIMEWTRLADRAGWPGADEKAHTFETGARCDLPEFRVFERLAGRWSGTLRTRDADGQWQEVPAELEGHRVLDGCAVLSLLSYEEEGAVRRSFSLKTYNTYAGVFEDTRLDNLPGTPARVLYGKSGAEDAASVELVEPAAEGEVRERYVWGLDDPEEVRLRVFESRDGGQTWTAARSATFTPE